MMEMGEQQYGFTDLRHLIDDHFSGHGSLVQWHQHYGMVLVGGGDDRQVGQMATEVILPTPPPQHLPMPPPALPPSQARMDPFSGLFEDGGSGYSQGRWPRQETLTLLEIRSRLDPKFKEAAHKAPLWEEVSRIMTEEHGYQRSGKKCREKLENLYKYYKKTKEGRAGRQDGKHYRFFRQLEALYGDQSNRSTNVETNTSIAGNNNTAFHFQITTGAGSANAQFDVLEALRQSHNKPNCNLSFSSSSGSYNSFSEEEGDDNRNGNDDLTAAVGFASNDDLNRGRKDGGTRSLKRGRKSSWKSKIKRFVGIQMKKFMDVQEAWLERMLWTLEHKEQERMLREEEWRKQETARLEKEHKYWANERAWVEARDAALMEALERVSGRETKHLSPEDLTSTEYFWEDSFDNRNGQESEALDAGNPSSRRWPENEIAGLIKLRSGMEQRFRKGGFLKAALWEEISAGMAAMGYERSAKRCKEKWENINKYFRKTKECKKKRKENSRTCPYYKHLDSLYSSQGSGYGGEMQERSDDAVDRDGDGVDDGGDGDGQEQNVASPSASNVGTVGNDSCFQFLLEGESLWENHQAMKHINSSAGDQS